jgi:hypothetical protein
VGTAGARLGGRLELRHDPGQALRERVVDLARQPLALLQDAGLALHLLALAGALVA